MAIIQGAPVTLGSIAAQDALPVEPNDPFLLMHSPHNWEAAEVEGEVYWLPVLQPLTIRGGLLGTKPSRDKDGKPNHTAAIDKMRRRRVPRIVLEETSEYLRAYDCRGPSSKRAGTFYADAWEKPQTVAGAYSPERDEAGYAAWRLQLMRSGRIEAPHPSIIAGLIARYQGHQDRITSAPDTPAMKRKASQVQSLADRAKAAKVPEPQAPAPAPKANGRKAA